MIRIIGYEPGDEALLVRQPAQLAQPNMPIPELAAKGRAWTATEGARVLCIAGLHFNDEHYATAWASFAANKRMGFVRLSRAIARVIDGALADCRRVDCLVVAGFEPGHRFAMDLRLMPEATLRAAGANGADLVVHARLGGG